MLDLRTMLAQADGTMDLCTLSATQIGQRTLGVQVMVSNLLPAFSVNIANNSKVPGLQSVENLSGLGSEAVKIESRSAGVNTTAIIWRANGYEVDLAFTSKDMSLNNRFYSFVVSDLRSVEN